MTAQRIGIVADIHGDLDGLRAVIGAARENGATELWCLGDIIGRDRSIECLELIFETASRIIIGNHEAVSVGLEPVDLLTEYGRSSILPTVELLNDDPRWPAWADRLRQLPAVGTLPSPRPLILAHATPDDPLWGGLRGVADWAAIAATLAPSTVVLAGHSHRPTLCQSNGGSSYTRAWNKLRDGVVLELERLYLLNPGAVSHRDRNWGLLTADADGAPTSFEWRSARSTAVNRRLMSYPSTKL